MVKEEFNKLCIRISNIELGESEVQQKYRLNNSIEYEQRYLKMAMS
jgi:hypothetical protein